MPRAAADAERIYRWVGQAARLIDTLYSLAERPERCEAVERLSEPNHQIRKLLYGRKPHTYRVYFDVVGTTVRILPIRHGARQEPRARDRDG